MIEMGADIDATDGEGNTPLHLSVLSGHEKLVRLLLQHAAMITRNALGHAPRDYAVAKQTQSLTNARNESINKCAQRESYSVYFSAAAIGFAWTSGRRLWVTSDGRRGGGGGKLVAGRATTRGRGATRAAALGAAAARAHMSKRRAMISGYFESPTL